MNFVSVDVETTGTEPDDSVLEIGWSVITKAHGRHEIAAPQSVLVKPTKPIPVSAMAVHGIRNCDATGGVTLTDGIKQLMAAAPPNTTFVAHNAAFEKMFLRSIGPWICTYRCALRLWKEAPEYNEGALRYWLRLPFDRPEASPAARALAMPSHRAGPDAYVVAHILVRLLELGTPIEELIAWSAEPALLPRMPFGKHAGMPFSELPDDYLKWLKTKEFGDDLYYTVEVELGRRA